jgi:predicted permease
VLATLGVNPEQGRPFSLADDTPGAAPVVILSHDLWVRSFGSAADVVGTEIALSGMIHEVIGVMPRGFRFPSPRTSAWVPAGFDPAAPPVNQHTYAGIARLRAGVAPQEALTELDGLVGRFAEEMPQAYGGGFVESSGFRVVMRGLLEDTVGGVRALLALVLAAAALVLIIACANVANLTLLRSEGRRREVAVRAALGASRAALLRYSLSEASVLAIAGGALGVALAWAGVRLLVLAAPVGLSRVDEITMRPLAVIGALAVVVMVSVILGAVSALRGRLGLADQLKSGGRVGSADRRRMRVRGAFVVTQVSMAVLLMAGSGVLLRSFVKLRAVDPGFSADNVLTLQLSLAPTKYDNDASLRFFEQVSERLRGLPGVTAVGVVDGLPLGSRASDNLNGFADLPGGAEQNVLVDTKFAGPGYLEALGMRLLEGRTFERRDMQAGNPGAVVTRALARELWPGESALGKRARPLMTDYPWHTIVGVVDDVRTEDITRAPEPTIYFPYTDFRWSRSFFVAIRTEGPPEPLLPAVRSEVWALDPDIPLASVATMTELVAGHLSRATFTLTLVGVAATMALFLCAVGIYGVIAYSVSQRHFEIGVRMALGARGPQVAGMVLRQTMMLVAVGIAIGLMLAFAGMGLMDSLLFEVSATDPLTLMAVALGLALVAAMAGTVPARRATRVDAVIALQGD